MNKTGWRFQNKIRKTTCWFPREPWNASILIPGQRMLCWQSFKRHFLCCFILSTASRHRALHLIMKWYFQSLPFFTYLSFFSLSLDIWWNFKHPKWIYLILLHNQGHIVAALAASDFLPANGTTTDWKTKTEDTSPLHARTKRHLGVEMPVTVHWNKRV